MSVPAIEYTVDERDAIEGILNIERCLAMGRCCSIRGMAGWEEDDGGYATGRMCLVVIDDKGQLLDDENSGFGGNAEGNSRTVTGCWDCRDFIIPFVSFGDTRGELLNVSGERSERSADGMEGEEDRMEVRRERDDG